MTLTNEGWREAGALIPVRGDKRTCDMSRYVAHDACSDHQGRFVALNFSNRDLALAFPVLSDPLGDRPAEAKHLFENIDTHHRLGLLGLRSTGSQAWTDDPFVTGHGSFDQGPPIIPR